MKKIRFVILCLLSCSLFNCITTDPFDPENTYTIENLVNQEVICVFSVRPEYARYIYEDKREKDSVVIQSNQSKRLFTIYHGEILKPSEVLTQMIFISSKKDTLLTIDQINDDDWIYTDSVTQVSFRHWLYKFSME